MIEFVGTTKEKFWVTVAIITMIVIAGLVMFSDIFFVLLFFAMIAVPVAIWVEVFRLENKKE